MRRNKILLILGLLFILSGIIIYRWLSYSKFSSIDQELSQLYKYEKNHDPENYIADCINEIKESINFPREDPSYAILHYDKFWKGDKKITGKQLNSLLSLLNDSSSYQWGEVGTPYFDRIITFHDKAGLCIGVTKVSYDGQTYSTPSTARMKWGALQGDNLNKLIGIIEEKK